MPVDVCPQVLDPTASEALRSSYLDKTSLLGCGPKDVRDICRRAIAALTMTPPAGFSSRKGAATGTLALAMDAEVDNEDDEDKEEDEEEEESGDESPMAASETGSLLQDLLGAGPLGKDESSSEMTVPGSGVWAVGPGGSSGGGDGGGDGGDGIFVSRALTALALAKAAAVPKKQRRRPATAATAAAAAAAAAAALAAVEELLRPLISRRLTATEAAAAKAARRRAAALARRAAVAAERGEAHGGSEDDYDSDREAAAAERGDRFGSEEEEEEEEEEGGEDEFDDEWRPCFAFVPMTPTSVRALFVLNFERSDAGLERHRRRAWCCCFAAIF